MLYPKEGLYPKKEFYTRKEIAKMLSISRSTLYRWLDEYDIKLKKGLVPHGEYEQIKKLVTRPKKQRK